VLLHGGLADSREWRRPLEGLADEFTVVAWDAPGVAEADLRAVLSCWAWRDHR
jgi:pimeloyl-ACP methyl ester carboxylesterase